MTKTREAAWTPPRAAAEKYEHNARSGGTPAAPREKDLVWRLVVPGD